MSADPPEIPLGVIPLAPVRKYNLNCLYDFELDYIVQAIRRDLRSETDRITSDPYWAEMHKFNVRHATRMLELLNPKSRANANTIGDKNANYE